MEMNERTMIGLYHCPAARATEGKWGREEEWGGVGGGGGVEGGGR